MKKFMEEFKEFALKGNVMDMAIGVIIGGAFTAIVKAFTDDFINPILGLIGGAEFGGKIPLGDSGQYLMWGDFLSAVVNFLIVALILFCMLKGINKLMELGKKNKEAEEEVTEKTCPFCQSKISIKATRCPHCTSQLED